MHCPVCGHDCVTDARALLTELPGRFAPCPDCMGLVYDKQSPPPDIDTVEPCPSCGKRFIDEVFARIYRVMVAEGDLAGTEPLAAVGTPLVHPGSAMHRAPYLPPGSLVLLSRSVGERAAARLVAEVPEVRGVVRTGAATPGIKDTDAAPQVYTLLAGCDVRADIFHTRAGPIVVYKQQSALHIEFPRDRDPKILALEREIGRHRPRTFVDACSGAGTLGLAAIRAGVPHVIANDAWYAAAYWTAYNLQVNRGPGVPGWAELFLSHRPQYIWGLAWVARRHLLPETAVSGGRSLRKATAACRIHCVPTEKPRPMRSAERYQSPGGGGDLLPRVPVQARKGADLP
ncbi:MAG: hypothetical protein XD82_0754 [Methanoculleus marisnigri]|uniref:Methyltransferase n=1 Tax=Methanoculleus marisnigri TaxID=2198 RepID=A0A101GPI7_9EURY|nr:MAG: hypothetical protein XD82_0754 [Methanoculleus marisnigri]